MFKTSTKPMVGVQEIKEHLERCHELHLLDPELNNATESEVASMKVDMAILIGMTVGLLAGHEAKPQPPSETAE